MSATSKENEIWRGIHYYSHFGLKKMKKMEGRLSFLFFSYFLMTAVAANFFGQPVVNTTTCSFRSNSGFCSGDCKTYLTPSAKCYNPASLFPGDPQWGPFDVLDNCVMSNSLIQVNRSFYLSTDGTCTNRTDGFVLPTIECIGPFGSPRPWGELRCSFGI
jgi:hypothetical protein